MARTPTTTKTPLNIIVHIPFVAPGDKAKLIEIADYTTATLQVLNRLMNWRDAQPEIKGLVSALEGNKPVDVSAIDRRIKELLNPSEGEPRYPVLVEISNWFRAASERGNENAATQLLMTAFISTTMLKVACESKPELFQRLSRDRSFWPVLASTDPQWHARAQKQIEAIKLGQQTMQINFSKAKRSSASVRHWAESILKTLQENQIRMRDFEDLGKGLFLLEDDYQISVAEIPGWAKECKDLPPFNRKNVPLWWSVAKSALKHQCPDIEKRPEWVNIRNWQRSKNDWRKVTPGRARAAVYEAIRRAMQELAPA